MNDLDNLISKYAPKEILNEIADRMESIGDYEGAMWIRDPANKKFFNSWKSSTRAEELMASMPSNPFSSWREPAISRILYDPLEEIKLQYQFLNEFIEFLASYQNFIWNFTEKKEIFFSDEKYIQELINICSSTDWIVKEGKASSNRWNSEKMKRESFTLPCYTIENSITKSYGDLHIASLAEDGIVNLLFFKITNKEKRGNAFNTLKEFKEVMSLLLLDHPMKPTAVTSIVLQYDDDGKHADEAWRFARVEDEVLVKQSRLGRFWASCGAVMAPEISDNDDPSRLYFFNKEKALSIKKIADENDFPNPFRAARKTIYDAATEKILMGKSN
jgi:hypothetical protein